MSQQYQTRCATPAKPSTSQTAQSSGPQQAEGLDQHIEQHLARIPVAFPETAPLALFKNPKWGAEPRIQALSQSFSEFDDRASQMCEAALTGGPKDLRINTLRMTLKAQMRQSMNEVAEVIRGQNQRNEQHIC